MENPRVSCERSCTSTGSQRRRSAARPARGGIASSSAITCRRSRCVAGDRRRDPVTSRSLRPVRRLGFDAPDILRQALLPQLLPDRQDLADVEPVVVRQPANRGPLRLPAPLSVERQINKELLRRELVEERIGGLRDLPPSCQHLRERWRAHRTAGREVPLNIFAQHDPLRAVKEIALLLPREVADDPTDRVHLAEVPRAGVLAHALQPAQPLATREPQLIDEGMRPPRWLLLSRPSGT